MVFLFFRPENRKTGNCKSNYLFFVNQAEEHPYLRCGGCQTKMIQMIFHTICAPACAIME